MLDGHGCGFDKLGEVRAARCHERSILAREMLVMNRQGMVLLLGSDTLSIRREDNG